MKVFVDADVCLDLILKREPFDFDAELMFSAFSRRYYAAYTTPLVFANLHYILAKHGSASGATELLQKLRQLVRLIPVTEEVMDLAMHSKFKDFEDAVQYFSARRRDVDHIVTRNIKDYRHSDIPVLLPTEFNRLYVYGVEEIENS